MVPNLSTGKTEAVIQLRGEGARQARRRLHGVALPSLLTESKVWPGSRITAAPKYRHLGGFITREVWSWKPATDAGLHGMPFVDTERQYTAVAMLRWMTTCRFLPLLLNSPKSISKLHQITADLKIIGSDYPPVLSPAFLSISLTHL